MQRTPSYFALLLIVTAGFGFVKCSRKNVEDQAHWKKLGVDDLKKFNKVKIIDKPAKNIILFVGDGMGPTTVTASRIYGKTETGSFSFERFPNVGLLKTYSANKFVPDSCSTATALFCGVKANQKTSGVDATVPYNDCEASLNASARLDSIVKWAQDAGKSTGFVTTTRVTHATPSALYAHTPNRKWECETTIPEGDRSKCKDIARQLVEDLPGKNIQVVFGGGRQCMQTNVTHSEADPVDTWSCFSMDGRDLIRDWKNDKIKRKVSHAVVQNNEELAKLNVDEVDYALGIFANGHLKMNYDRNTGPQGMPSLLEMTEKAIQILRKNSNGYLLMVEGGLIDFGHHRGHAKQALDETAQMDKAVEKAVSMTDSENTLIIVTADHSHSMVFTGYAGRDQNVLDVAQKSPMDQMPYTSLLYGTGGPNNYQFKVVEGKATRRDPSLDDTQSFDYSQQAVVYADEVAHGGTDVVVYAQGPMAHLFASVHEQTYVAYVISYAAKIGPLKDFSNSQGKVTMCFRDFMFMFVCVNLLNYLFKLNIH